MLIIKKCLSFLKDHFNLEIDIYGIVRVNVKNLSYRVNYYFNTNMEAFVIEN